MAIDLDRGKIFCKRLITRLIALLAFSGISWSNARKVASVSLRTLGAIGACSYPAATVLVSYVKPQSGV